MDLPWMRQGNCWGVDPLVMHPEFSQGKTDSRVNKAKKICKDCPVTDHCLRYALKREIDSGVYAGMTYEERSNSMSNWTHSQCEQCWIANNSEVTGDGEFISVRSPIRILDPRVETCCFCGNVTIIGIYVRADPATLQHCSGHPE